MIRLIIAACALFVAPAAFADEACSAHKWKAASMLAAVEAPVAALSGETVVSGTLPVAFAIPLTATADVFYQTPPERTPTAETNGAVVFLAAPDEAGSFYIALSERAWIDVIQNGRIVPSADFSSAAGCLLRKIVRFDLEAAPATIQISGAPSAAVLMVISRSEEPAA